MFSLMCMRKIRPQYIYMRSLTSWQLMFKEHGEPLDVLYEHEVEVKCPKNKEVLINYRKSPINPSDINAIQGVYPIKPELPGVGGNEGAGYVLECGPDVISLKPGDLVVPSSTALGTWRTIGNLKEDQLIRLNSKLPIENAAILNTNPSTAYLMLTSFTNLNADDCVIQNGATSAVGIYVMQMCKILGVKTINLFRSRSTPEETEATRNKLLNFGGTLVLTEEELKHSKEIKNLGHIKLGFNCLGGKPTLSIIRNLERQGILVTYGGMTRQPIPVPIGPLIFKDIQLRGFWVSGFAKKPSYLTKRLAMFEQISEWMIDGKLKLSPFDEISHTEWKTAINRSMFKDGTPKALPRKAIISFPKVK